MQAPIPHLGKVPLDQVIGPPRAASSEVTSQEWLLPEGSWLVAAPDNSPKT